MTGAAKATGTEFESLPAGEGSVLAPSEVDSWNALREIPVRLAVDIPLPSMSMRALGALAPGQVLVSPVPTSEDLPIAVGGALVSWARFECVDGRMAMRITRLA